MASEDSWLDLMLGSPEWRAIESLEDTLAANAQRQADTNIDNHFLLEKLFAQDRAQANEIRDLRTCLKVLMDMLVASGGLDRQDFGFRMEAELDRVRGEAEEKARERNLVACDLCQKKVPREKTNISSSGTFCDRCFNR